MIEEKKLDLFQLNCEELDFFCKNNINYTQDVSLLEKIFLQNDNALYMDVYIRYLEDDYVANWILRNASFLPEFLIIKLNKKLYTKKNYNKLPNFFKHEKWHLNNFEISDMIRDVAVPIYKYKDKHYGHRDFSLFAFNHKNKKFVYKYYQILEKNPISTGAWEIALKYLIEKHVDDIFYIIKEFSSYLHQDTLLDCLINELKSLENNTPLVKERSLLVQGELYKLLSIALSHNLSTSLHKITHNNLKEIPNFLDYIGDLSLANLITDENDFSFIYFLENKANQEILSSLTSNFFNININKKNADDFLSLFLKMLSNYHNQNKKISVLLKFKNKKNIKEQEILYFLYRFIHKCNMKTLVFLSEQIKIYIKSNKKFEFLVPYRNSIEKLLQKKKPCLYLAKNIDIYSPLGILIQKLNLIEKNIVNDYFIDWSILKNSIILKFNKEVLTYNEIKILTNESLLTIDNFLNLYECNIISNIKIKNKTIQELYYGNNNK